MYTNVTGLQNAHIVDIGVTKQGSTEWDDLESNLISFERMCQPAQVTHCEDCTKPTCVSGILRGKWWKKCACMKAGNKSLVSPPTRLTM